VSGNSGEGGGREGGRDEITIFDMKRKNKKRWKKNKHLKIGGAILFLQKVRDMERDPWISIT
jgi:hypothetical protein